MLLHITLEAKSSSREVDSALTRNPDLKRPICHSLLGINELKKPHQTALGIGSIFSIHFYSKIFQHLVHFKLISDSLGLNAVT